MHYDIGQYPGDLSFTLLSVAGQLVIPASQTRFSLVIFPSRQNAFLLSNNSNISGENGIAFPQNGVPIILNYRDVGEVVRKPWYGNPVGGAVTIGWIEALEG